MNTLFTHAPATEPPVWLMTGCATGFGLALARQAIARGHRTVVTARDPSGLEGLGATDRVLVLPLDVTKPDEAAAATRAADFPKAPASAQA